MDPIVIWPPVPPCPASCYECHSSVPGGCGNGLQAPVQHGKQLNADVTLSALVLGVLIVAAGVVRRFRSVAQ